jgi:hypothetical protein
MLFQKMLSAVFYRSVCLMSQKSLASSTILYAMLTGIQNKPLFSAKDSIEAILSQSIPHSFLAFLYPEK